MSASVVPNPPIAYLVPIAGPAMDAVKLVDKPGGLTMGRYEQCDVCLPSDAEKVSRSHAHFAFNDGKWCIADLNSRWGTYVNGVRLTSGFELPLSDGDLIRITPWTFTLSPVAEPRAMRSQNDSGQTIVRSVSVDRVRSLADDMLALLLESAAAIHGANDEKQLADTLMDAACRGTGLSNAAMLRPMDASSGQFEMIASRMSPVAAYAQGSAAFSRSLIHAASSGAVAELSGNNMTDDVSQSIVQMKIAAAICVPLMLGGSVAAYLYLDSRGGVVQNLRPNASAFCVALGRIASLALANLKRMDMEKREERIRADLAAAAAAQKWILPKRESVYGKFKCLGESRPGQYVGGDFFDIIDLGDSKLAVALGDVAGKGVAASVLMTASQGFLHASLLQSGDPCKAVSSLNEFVRPRRPESKFITMWVGVFDLKNHTLKYVDAGHSYAMLRRANGEFLQLSEGPGLPIGLDESNYENVTVALEAGDEFLVVSDGIIEQFGIVSLSDGSISREQFELAGVHQSLSRPSNDRVADLFDAVVAHAGTTQLGDDATALLVGW